MSTKYVQLGCFWSHCKQFVHLLCIYNEQMQVEGRSFMVAML